MKRYALDVMRTETLIVQIQVCDGIVNRPLTTGAERTFCVGAESDEEYEPDDDGGVEWAESDHAERISESAP
jgi:hypothetical protein